MIPQKLRQLLSKPATSTHPSITQTKRPAELQAKRWHPQFPMNASSFRGDKSVIIETAETYFLVPLDKIHELIGDTLTKGSWYLPSTTVVIDCSKVASKDMHALLSLLTSNPPKPAPRDKQDTVFGCIRALQSLHSILGFPYPARILSLLVPNADQPVLYALACLFGDRQRQLEAAKQIMRDAHNPLFFDPIVIDLLMLKPAHFAKLVAWWNEAEVHWRSKEIELKTRPHPDDNLLKFSPSCRAGIGCNAYRQYQKEFFKARCAAADQVIQSYRIGQAVAWYYAPAIKTACEAVLGCHKCADRLSQAFARCGGWQLGEPPLS